MTPPRLTCLLETLRDRPILQKFCGDFGFQIAIKFLSFGFSIYTLHLITHALGPEQYGIYALVLGFANLFAGFVNISVRPLVIRDVGSEQMTLQDGSETVLHLMLLTAPIAYIVMVLAGYFCVPQYLSYVALAGLPYFLIPFNEQTVILVCQGKIKQSRIPHFCNVVAMTLLCFLLLAPDSSVTLVLICSLVATCLRAAGELCLVARDVHLRLRQHWDTVKRYLREGSVLVLCTLIGILHHKIDLLMLANFERLHSLAPYLPGFPVANAIAPATFNHEASIGYYSGAYRFLDMLRICPEFILATAIPILARMKTPTEFRHFSTKVFLALLGMAIAAMAFFFLTGPYLIDWVLGDDFANSVPLLFILTWAVPALMLRPLFRRMVVLRRLEKHLIWITVISLLVNVLSNLYCIPLYGEQGAAVTTVISESIFMALAFMISILAICRWDSDGNLSPDNTEA